MSVRIQGKFLNTKIARRILGVFMLSAFLPVSLATGLIYLRAADHMTDQAERQVRESAKQRGMSVIERLTLAGTELAAVAEQLRQSSERVPVSAGALSRDIVGSRLTRVVLVEADREQELGDGTGGQALTPTERDQLGTGRPALRVEPGGGQILVGLPLDPEAPETAVLWAAVDPDFLWGALHPEVLGDGSDACVLDAGMGPLYCSREVGQALFEALRGVGSGSRDANFEWEDAEGTRHGAMWKLFLGYEFGAPDWTLVSGDAESVALLPLTMLRNSFILIGALTLAVVFFLANIQIRWTTEPVERLTEATRLVADGDFQARVTIESDDEFESLAGSFNTMSDRLKDHFETLLAFGEVDRAILSALDKETIATTLLPRAQDLMKCDAANVAIFSSSQVDNGGTATVFVVAGKNRNPVLAGTVVLTPAEVEELLARPDELAIDRARGGRSYIELEAFHSAGIAHFLLYPLVESGRLRGVFTLGYRESPPPDPELRATARHMADQVAVAFSNAHLLEEISDLSDGAIRAFARAVDAKSRWTAGHSERVTALAVRLGVTLGLPEEELQLLQRGGLLHDIGKIGVPGAVLDKPGKLDDQELELVRAHAEIGASILEPIGAFETIIPIVRHHHERFDGGGYPRGLAGEDIPFLARVMSVPDVFDAIGSGRPYHAALEQERALRIIAEGSGSQFDPEIAAAFLNMMTEGSGLGPGHAEPADLAIA